MKEANSNGDVSAALGQVRLSSLFWRGNFINDTLAQPLQWHIWCDGKDAVSSVFQSGKWVPGPELDVEATNSGRLITDHAMNMVRRGFNGVKAPTVGVVFHVADEFATSVVRSEYSTPDKYDLGEVVCAGEPASIIEDACEPQMDYRYIPLSGSRSAVAVRLSRERWEVLSTLMSIKSPVRVAVLSAPMCMASLLPAAYDPVRQDEDSVEYFLIQYHRMTTVFGFRPPNRNDESKPSGLMTMWVLPHGGKTSPSNVGSRLASDILMRNLNVATIHVIGARPGAAIDETASQIESGVAQLAGRIQLDMSVGTFEEFCSEMAQKIGMDRIPARPEFLVAGRKYLSWDGTCEKWFGRDEKKAAEQLMAALPQNFSNKTTAIEERRVTYADALAVVLGRGAFVIAILATIGALVYAGLKVSLALSSPFWSADSKAMTGTTAALASQVAIAEANEYWTKALLPRSLGWVAMESLCDMIADEAGLTLERASFKVEMLPLTREEQASNALPKTLGYRCIWRLEGRADAAGTAVLDSTQGSEVSRQVVHRMAQAMAVNGFSKEVKSSTLPPATVKIERGQGDGRQAGSRFVFLVSQVVPPSSLPFSLPNAPKPLPSKKVVAQASKEP